MSDNINKMDFKQLRNEVQLLRDELAIMKRKYEDIIYNLDTDNFSSRFVKEQGDMRTAIKVTAKGIETKVSNEEFQSTKTQTAQKIESEVKKLTDADKELSTKITQTADAIRTEVQGATEILDGKFDNYSTKEQTANEISSAVKSVNETTDSKLANYSTIKQTADKITSTVTKNFVTNLIDGEYVTSEELSSEISQTVSDISLRVNTVEGKTNSISVNDSGIAIDGSRTKIKSVIYLTDANGDNAATLYCSSQNGRHLYLNSSYNPSGGQLDYVYIGDYVQAYDYDTGTWEDSHNVYVGRETGGSEYSWKVATEGWVKKKIGGGGGTFVAVFG